LRRDYREWIIERGKLDRGIVEREITEWRDKTERRN
jgi:hypothetical protein